MLLQIRPILLKVNLLDLWSVLLESGTLPVDSKQHQSTEGVVA